MLQPEPQRQLLAWEELALQLCSPGWGPPKARPLCSCAWTGGEGTESETLRPTRERGEGWGGAQGDAVG